MARARAQPGPAERGCGFGLQVRGRPRKRRAGSSRGEGSPGPRDGQLKSGGRGGPSRGRRWGRGAGRARLSGTEMPSLLLTETTCVSRQRDRDAAEPGAGGWGLAGGMQAGPTVCPGVYVCV